MRHLAGVLTVIGACLAVLSSALGVRAEPLEPAVVPPVLVSDPGVAYPPEALRAGFYERVEVVLILELDATGKVERASVEVPQRPEFYEAAAAAAERLRFEPARRGARAVPARLRYRYVFEPPPATLAGRVEDPTTGRPVRGVVVIVRTDDGEHRLETDAAGAFSVTGLRHGSARVEVEAPDYLPAGTDVALIPGSEARVSFRLERPRPAVATPTEEPVEVTVHGERPAPAVTTYTRAEVRQIPGTFGDPFRAIEAMPGVTPAASGIPFFFVRGAPPGNVGYFFDGIRVPYLYHVGFGPSVIQPALVDEVSLYPGGYPARLGRFAGGVVDAGATEPRADFHGEANLRLFDVGALVEAGFAGGRGTALLGGRYSYTGAVLSLVAPEIKLDYRDYQARFSYDLTPRDRVSVLGFGSYDLLAEITQSRVAGAEEIERVEFGTEFYRADLRYEHFWDGGKLLTGLTLGFDRSNAGFLMGEPRNVLDRSAALRVQAEARASDGVLIRAGADVALDAYRVESARYGDPDDPERQKFDRVFEPRDDVATGVWVDAVLDVGSRVQVTPGVRIDLYRSGSASAVGVEPRVAARFAVTPDLRIVHAYGVAHQPPSFVLPLSGLVPKLSGGLQRSLQGSAGVEVDLDDSTVATANVFCNGFFGTSDALSFTESGPPDYEARSQGVAFGAELFVKRRLTQRLGGFVSYTLSRSVRSSGRERYLSAFDRTHVANAAVAYDLGRGFRPGARLVFYTGAPVSRESDTLPPPRTTDTEREKPFYRLDVRMEKRWSLGRTAFISLVLEVMNATLRKERFTGEEIGPITIPSIGAEAGF